MDLKAVETSYARWAPVYDVVFGKVDTMGAPRLVEYWEVDPCATDHYGDDDMSPRTAGMAKESAKPDDEGGYGVKVEAEFTVGEYQIVILSATDSTGLDSWLKDTGYKIPDGAEPLLDWALMCSHWAVRRCTSRVSCSSVAPSAAVRTITPLDSGSTSLRIFFSRERSVSGSLREMPEVLPSGT